MSALTLLSVVAPAAPRVPQGASGDVASGFQSLLEALSGEDTPVPETSSGPGETSVLDEVKAATDTEATGFLMAPTQPPVPLIVPTETGSASDGKASGSTTGTGADLARLLSATGEALGGAHTTSLPSAGKGPVPKINEPQVQPTVIDTRPFQEQVPEDRVTRAEANGQKAGAADAQTRIAAALRPTTSPLPAPPAPLRPLAERTSRPLDAAVARTGEGTSVADPARPAAATLATAVLTADPSTRPAELAVAAVARDTASGGEVESLTSDLPPLGEGTAAQTQTPPAARDTAVSQLSRTTVEATAQIAAQILRRLEGRSTRFEMALTPDELGRVDVKLDIDSEGRLNARLAFDNPAAATDLRGRTDELRRQLEDAGFHLAEDAFEFADRDSGSSAFDRGQDTRNGSSRAFAAASRLNTEIDVAQPPRWLALSLSPSGLDMKV